MHRVEPQVFLVAQTQLDDLGLIQYFRYLDVHWQSDAKDGASALTEFMGRLCYKSFEPGLNPNVTKIREGNELYLENILKSRHGSVLEHATASFVFADVSRVFTHELVRHRVGAAYSQESLRYVRLTDLGLWLPPEINHDEKLVQLFETTFNSLEQVQNQLSIILDLDGKPFKDKKMLTSAMRRLAPIGLATTIGATFNHRTLRHLLQLRTEEAAESEIRLVFKKVGRICKNRWPTIYQDFKLQEDGSWKPEYLKV